MNSSETKETSTTAATTTTEAPEETTESAETTTEATTEATEPTTEATTTAKETQPAIDENGTYNSKDDVALYIYTYGHLPSNYVTKSEARDAGWEGGSLEDFFPGCSIGGDVFGNREGILPEKSGRKYYECDIDTKGKKSRGAKRIVYSNDGLIYYTDDHYETFTLLYGEE
ncbi:MAG: ribonuclease [Clostridiales bacterium]|nr:ribonuclease [Clostridiales bacterium]MBP5492984.1 ribonuclease [Clostridiales bacterium]